MRQLFRRHPYLVSALAIAGALTLFFAVRFVAGAIYWAAHHEEPIRPWMTVGYIGRSWDLNPRAIDKEAGFPPPQGHPRTLNDIARERGVPVEQIIEQAQQAINRLKAQEP
ncbi:hypothetical protein [Rhizobium sp. RU36D]|uniref:hypothetical protein n=1 Tax=Rhizobium sp. RU36D TaxID=1907415 RepID=UPI0009D7E910|nr:hypothetical protein [Rhizobium sp. RU36D]SMD01125.1 hypothetical protein SAMN05880593_11521 [Rhizobium sp. RU36D]